MHSSKADEMEFCLISKFVLSTHKSNIADDVIKHKRPLALVGETGGDQLFKDPSMLQRFQELSLLPDNDKEHILYTLDGLLQNVKTKKAFA